MLQTCFKSENPAAAPLKGGSTWPRSLEIIYQVTNTQFTSRSGFWSTVWTSLFNIQNKKAYESTDQITQHICVRQWQLKWQTMNRDCWKEDMHTRTSPHLASESIWIPCMLKNFWTNTGLQHSSQKSWVRVTNLVTFFDHHEQNKTYHLLLK